MLYMGNVNRIIFWVVIPLILFSYLAFRLTEWRTIGDEGRSLIAKKHSLNLKANNNFNCLILGGSNSMFSLSAEQMSSHSDLHCYNISLVKEGLELIGGQK